MMSYSGSSTAFDLHSQLAITIEWTNMSSCDYNVFVGPTLAIVRWFELYRYAKWVRFSLRCKYACIRSLERHHPNLYLFIHCLP